MTARNTARPTNTAPTVEQRGPDPTEQSRWRPLRALLGAIDGDIARLYEDRGVIGIRPRFTMALIRLERRGPMTIRKLAEALNVTHSAMSQTVSALRRAGLVDSTTGDDARTRDVALTEHGRSVVPFLEAEWRATEAAIRELEDEAPYALSRVAQDLEVALTRRSFHDRVLAHLTSEQAHRP